MKFWDTSAIVPLLVEESATRVMRELLDADPTVVVWWGAHTECVSALARRSREGLLDRTGEDQAKQILAKLATLWSEVLPSETLRARCERLLSVHPLRAADAFQLGASLVWSRGETTQSTIVSLDERLRAAGRREGFRILPN